MNQPATPPPVALPVRQILITVERTLLSGVSSFLGAVAVFPGGAWDAKHLAAAGIAAATAAAYQLSGALNAYLKA